MKEIFRTRLKALRKENNLRQEDMAKKLEVARSTYAEYERGRVTPSADKLEALARHLDVSVDYLIGNTNFKDGEIKKDAPKDILDVSHHMKLIMDYLLDHSMALTLDGVILDTDSRELMLSSLENTLRMAQKINGKG